MVVWVGQSVSLPRGAVGWSVYIFLAELRIDHFVSLTHDVVLWKVCVSFSQCSGLVVLYLVLGEICVCQFLSFPHVAVGRSGVFSSQCSGLVSLSLFLRVLWVGQFVFIAQSAVGFIIYVGTSSNCGLVSLCLFVVTLWVR